MNEDKEFNELIKKSLLGDTLEIPESVMEKIKDDVEGKSLKIVEITTVLQDSKGGKIEIVNRDESYIDRVIDHIVFASNDEDEEDYNDD